MASSDCPPWIDPGSAFRLVVKVTKYVVVGEYGEYDQVDSRQSSNTTYGLTGTVSTPWLSFMRREAEEAELKAAAAREAAQAAAREEIEATRNELSAIHAQEDVVDMMPLEVHVQETTAAMRTLFPQDELQVELVKKMTPRRKQLAKKVRKT